MHVAARAPNTRRVSPGPNTIPFEVSSPGEAAAAEFFQLFYLYQFQIYIVWFWFSYITVATPLALVVLASGAVNVVISRANQRTIAKLTAYTTECVVLRDGKEVDKPTLALLLHASHSTQSQPSDEKRGWQLLVLLCAVEISLALTVEACQRCTGSYLSSSLSPGIVSYFL